jgi:hypothetical protein
VEAFREDAMSNPIEHLAPLVNRLKPSIARRFRMQSKEYARSGRLKVYPSLSEKFSRVTNAAYVQGAAFATRSLLKAKEAKKQPVLIPVSIATALPGWQRSAEQLVAELDTTTAELITEIVDSGIAAGLSKSEIAKDIAKQFSDWTRDRAATIAEYELSSAYHDGAIDAAKLIGQQTGILVQVAWDIEPDACEICTGNFEEGWLDEGILFGSGDDAPPAHPNCRCSLSYREQS